MPINLLFLIIAFLTIIPVMQIICDEFKPLIHGIAFVINLLLIGWVLISIGWVLTSPLHRQVNYHEITYFENEDCYGVIVDNTFINATKLSGVINLNNETYHIKESQVGGWSTGIYWVMLTPIYEVVKKE